MSVDFQIEPVGGGAYDLVLDGEDGGSVDLVLIGNEAETHEAAVVQRVTYAYGMWYGESAFDRNDGFPWEQGVFGKEPLEGITALLYDRAIDLEGVEGFVEPPILMLDNETRDVSIQGQIQGASFVADVQQIVKRGDV